MITSFYLHRNIVGMAVDTVSMDRAQNGDWSVHRTFLSNNIWGLENLANVHKLEPKGYTIIAVPYKIQDGSGGPVRAFALPTATYAARINIQGDAPRISSSFAVAGIALLVALCWNS